MSVADDKREPVPAVDWWAPLSLTAPPPDLLQRLWREVRVTSPNAVVYLSPCEAGGGSGATVYGRRVVPDGSVAPGQFRIEEQP